MIDSHSNAILTLMADITTCWPVFTPAGTEQDITDARFDMLLDRLRGVDADIILGFGKEVADLFPQADPPALPQVINLIRGRQQLRNRDGATRQALEHKGTSTPAIATVHKWLIYQINPTLGMFFGRAQGELTWGQVKAANPDVTDDLLRQEAAKVHDHTGGKIQAIVNEALGVAA